MKKDSSGDMQEWIDANMSDWKFILHEAQIANKGAYTHEINKGIYSLRYFIDKAKNEQKKFTWEDLGCAANISKILGHKLYLLSKGR